MAFKHASTPIGQWASSDLSADNSKPDRFTLLKALSLAAHQLGLGPSVVATVDALLSCLPPKRNHDVVFASNATLVLRRNGISDRTLRRHLAELVNLGLMVRIDSPNGKRYSKRDPSMGTAMRFGLNLSPLFSAYHQLAALADQHVAEIEKIGYLRTKLRSIIRQVEDSGFSDLAIEARRIIRRQLSIHQLESMLTDLERLIPSSRNKPVDIPMTADEMSANNGQNVRHLQNSKKEKIIKETTDTSTSTTSSVLPNRTISLEQLSEACPEAKSFLPGQLSSQVDVIVHARRLAPMIGIDRNCYEAAEVKLGSLGAALTIWGLMERQDRITRFGAYFRSVTSGKHGQSFDPWALIDQLLKRTSHAASHCPRTMPA